MEQVAGQFGLDWKLFLSQGANFFILLWVLTRFVYRPLLQVMSERRERIEAGLHGAEEAERRLREIDAVRVERLAEADQKAVSIIGHAEQEAGVRAAAVVADAEARALQMGAEYERMIAQKEKAALDAVSREARQLVRAALIKAAELDPAKIDERLVEKAVEKARTLRA